MNDNNNNNNNFEHHNSINTFLNLPFLILKYIVQRIDSNIDRICFSLVCKKLFKSRDKYLVFNNKNLPLSQYFHDKYFKLRSFKYQIQHSRDIKEIVHLTVTDSDFFFSTLYHNDLTRSILSNSYVLYLPNETKKTDLLKVKIPPSVVNLYFTHNYKRNIDDTLINILEKSNITNIYFGHNFNQPLLQLQSLTKVKRIRFGEQFSQTLYAEYLPPNLEELTYYRFHSSPADTLNDTLPNTLKRLVIYGNYLHLQLKSLPPNLEHLEFNGSIDQFSKTLVSIVGLRTQLIRLLPHTITSFGLSSQGSTVNQSDQDILRPGDIPQSVTHLDLGNYAYTLTVGVIPTSVTHLKLYRYRRELKPLDLPDSLLEIDFGDANAYDQPIKPGVLPSSLKTLKLPYGYSQRLEIGSIPQGVETLHLSCGNQTLRAGVIPNSVKHLVINKFIGILDNDAIPPSVESIVFQGGLLTMNPISRIPKACLDITIKDTNTRLKYYFRRMGYDQSKNQNYYLVLPEFDDITRFRGGFIKDSFFNDYIYSQTKSNALQNAESHSFVNL